jgi:hypothetical protein
MIDCTEKRSYFRKVIKRFKSISYVQIPEASFFQRNNSAANRNQGLINIPHILCPITCSDSKAILSGSKNISQNNLELHALQNPTQSFIL